MEEEALPVHEGGGKGAWKEGDGGIGRHAKGRRRWHQPAPCREEELRRMDPAGERRRREVAAVLGLW
uniref:Uncharacterized protein n=1 Tax=Oryza punctata TaxID=4537 RepID=A0A0E0L9M9_ORYPU